ncbi:MAG: TldD/PmbA family protein [Clostridia bacterium]|jgi:TldD protein|nr:TldD/PmbA family protein [Clostridia bacterium]
MLNKSLCSEILAVAMSTGADFAEIYQELTRNNSIHLIDGKIDSVGDNVLSGVGVRAFLGTRTVYATTTDITREGLLRCAAGVADAIGQSKKEVSIHLTERIFPNIHPVKRMPGDVDIKERIDLLKEACTAARDYHEKISQVQGNLFSVDHTILISNSEGLYTTDRHLRTRLSVSAIASDGNENQSGFFGPGRGMGLEMFETIDPREVGIIAAKNAITNLYADYCPAGQMPVAIENGFGGVIFHEACGHSLEATSVAVGASQMAGKLGQKIANEKVTAIDDGTIPGAWGSVNIDDEGNPTQRNVLIENGVLKNYMIDRLGSRRMNMPMTGNSRRQGYAYEPTSRMTNTYIANGPDKNEDIIASIEYGLYAAKMGGGSVHPLTGAFNFAVTEGYIIRNGKICEPVRGASLIGTGSQILQDIDMVGQNLDMGTGMCGSRSGSVPTNVGQPLIRVSNITVGGRSK